MKNGEIYLGASAIKLKFSGIGTTGAMEASAPVKFLQLKIRVCPPRYSLHIPHHVHMGRCKNSGAEIDIYFLASKLRLPLLGRYHCRQG